MTSDKPKNEWDMPEGTEKGYYVNVARIQSSTLDFVIDFGRKLPNKEAVQLQSRIIMTPEHIELFISALKKHYEAYKKNKKEQPKPPDGWYFDDFRFKR